MLAELDAAAAPPMREAPAWYRSLFELPSVGVSSLDAAGRFVDVNDCYCRMTGYTRAELRGKHVLALTHPDDLPGDQERFARLLDGAEPAYEHEKRCVRKDGRIVWVHVSAGLLPGGSGRRRTLGVAFDITERKLAEAALRESEERLRRAVEHSPFPGMIHAEDGEVLTVNAAWTAHSGYGREDIPDLATWTLRAYGAEGEAIRARVATLYGLDRTVPEGEFVIRTRSGEERVWDFFSLPLGRDAGGRRLIFSTATDVTDRAVAERAVRESSERFGALADIISQLAWMADEHGDLFWYNRRWYEYTGTTLADVAGWDWQRVHHPDHVERVARKFQEAVRTGVAWEDTFPLRGRDGEWRWFLSRAVPIRDAEGRPRRWFGTNTDVTPLLAAEAELRALNETLEERVRSRTAALEAANAELESFSYSVAHDLRAPLRAIDGFSGLLAAEGPGAATAAEYVRRIRISVGRMSQLIDDLLNLARIGRVDMKREDVDLGGLAAEIVAELRHRDPERRAQVDIAGAWAGGDRAFLRILLENLLGNAWKFTRGRDPARITFGTCIHGGRHVFFVRDNGVGFEMAYAEKLFRPFERLHAPAEFSGTGIGLAIVARIVARHGGRAWGEGAPGKGATFYFTLDEVHPG